MSPQHAARCIETLVAEHDACRGFLRRAERALGLGGGSRGAPSNAGFTAVAALLAYLDNELETHILKEEGSLFPRLKAALPAGDRIVDEMVAEHDLIRIKRDDVHAVLETLLDGHDDVLAERGALRAALLPPGDSPRSPVSLSSLASLREVTATVAEKLRVHFENEEQLVFPLAPDLLAAAELELIAQEMEALAAPSG